MHILLTTLQHVESAFYGRVGQQLRDRGHQVSHLTFSRRSATLLARAGFTAICLPDRMALIDLAHIDVDAEVERIERTYDTPTLRDLYVTDDVCRNRSEQANVERAIRHVRAIEQILDELSPDVVVPEVGNETIRTVAWLVAQQRGIPVLFLLYTIFPRPLRLAVDRLDARPFSHQDLAPLDASQARELEEFVTRFVSHNTPIREYRESGLTTHRLRMLARHTAVRLLYDADNEYLEPLRWVTGYARETVAAKAARPFYQRRQDGRPYVYFPLHVTDDYKIKRLIPHCADQAAIIELVARSLPHGVDLVTKEHPMAVGRTPLALLRRLRRISNVRIVAPRTSSHDLISGSRAVVVISSTVGLEALLHRKTVLTIGKPFYSGYGVTLDAESFAEIRDLVPRMLQHKPDGDRIQRFLYAAMQCGLDGAPALVDRSDANTRRLAGSIEYAATTELARRNGTVLPLRPAGPGTPPPGAASARWE